MTARHDIVWVAHLTVASATTHAVPTAATDPTTRGGGRMPSGAYILWPV